MTRLETERLILRPVERSDRAAVLSLINNLEISKWLSRVAYPYTEAHADEFLGFVLDDGRPEIARPFAITFKDAPEEMIGCMGVEPGTLEDSSLDRKAEFGYWLGQPFWGHGVVSEAALRMVRMGFRCAGYKKLTAGYICGNDGSARILEKCGFVDIGAKPIFCLARGEEVEGRDLVLTRERWEARQDGTA